MQKANVKFLLLHPRTDRDIHEFVSWAKHFSDCLFTVRAAPLLV